MWHICSHLFPTDTNWVVVLVAALLQVVWGFVYYAAIVQKPWSRLVALDKGVKKFDQIKTRYPMWYCVAHTWGCAIIRSLAVLALARFVNAGTCCQWQQVGVAITILNVCGHESSVWAQRPCVLMCLDTFADFVGMSLTAGYLSWAM